MKQIYLLIFATISLNAQSQTNHALTFNGTSNVVNIGTPLATGASYTKEAWVYLTTHSGPRNIISSVDVPLWIDNGFLRAGQAANYDHVRDATLFPINQWVHVAVTSAGGVMKLYRDGILISTSVPGIGAYIAQPTFIGAHQGSQAFWEGAIDEVRIWSTELTQAQIKATMFKGPVSNATNLVDYYKFNEGVGTTLTNSSTNGTGSNGAIVSGTWSASPVIQNANALSVEGAATDYVNIGSSATLKPTTALTHEVWIKAANFSVAGTQQVTSNFENGGYGIGLVNNNIQWELKSSSFPTGYSVVTYPASNLVNNQWYHIAGTFDGSFMRLYVNGVEVGSLNLGGTGRTIIYNIPGNSMLIGAEASSGSAPVAGFYYNGLVDEVRIWNVLRTPAKILEFANKELDPSNGTETSGLVAYYTFNQGNTNGTNTALTTVPDLKGTNNGTLFNFALTGTTSNFVTQSISLILLPVEWKSFTARVQDNKTFLQWSTSREANTKEFGVQHSMNGNSFTNIGTVLAAGNSVADKNYGFVHASPVTGANYYRLAQKDIDGNINYSEIRKIEFRKEAKPFVIQNTIVTNGLLKVMINKPLMVSFFNGDGKLLFKKQYTPGSHDIEVARFPKGMYWLSTKGNTEKVMVK
ncbi:LamG-like jellyroll fold domain-containing protein [Flavitalea sp.]|nr:LamG domain-containing protein [Flavitalea sp.]